MPRDGHGPSSGGPSTSAREGEHDLGSARARSCAPRADGSLLPPPGPASAVASDTRWLRRLGRRLFLLDAVLVDDRRRPAPCWSGSRPARPQLIIGDGTLSRILGQLPFSATSRPGLAAVRLRPGRPAARGGLGRAAGLHPDLRRPGARRRRRRVPPGRPRQRLLLGPGRDRQLHGPVRALPVRARVSLPARDLPAAAAAAGPPARCCTGPAGGPRAGRTACSWSAGATRSTRWSPSSSASPTPGSRSSAPACPRATPPTGSSVPVVGSLTSVPEAVAKLGVDTVAVTASRGLTSGVLKRLGWDLEGAGVDLVVAPGADRRRRPPGARPAGLRPASCSTSSSPSSPARPGR